MQGTGPVGGTGAGDGTGAAGRGVSSGTSRSPVPGAVDVAGSGFLEVPGCAGATGPTAPDRGVAGCRAAGDGEACWGADMAARRGFTHALGPPDSGRAPEGMRMTEVRDVGVVLDAIR